MKIMKVVYLRMNKNQLKKRGKLIKIYSIKEK